MTDEARIEALYHIDRFAKRAQDQYLQILSTRDKTMIASAKESWDRVRAEREELLRSA